MSDPGSNQPGPSRKDGQHILDTPDSHFACRKHTSHRLLPLFGASDTYADILSRRYYRRFSIPHVEPHVRET